MHRMVPETQNMIALNAFVFIEPHALQLLDPSLFGFFPEFFILIMQQILTKASLRGPRRPGSAAAV